MKQARSLHHQKTYLTSRRPLQPACIHTSTCQRCRGVTTLFHFPPTIFHSAIFGLQAHGLKQTCWFSSWSWLPPLCVASTAEREPAADAAPRSAPLPLPLHPLPCCAQTLSTYILLSLLFVVWLLSELLTLSLWHFRNCSFDQPNCGADLTSTYTGQQVSLQLQS